MGKFDSFMKLCMTPITFMYVKETYENGEIKTKIIKTSNIKNLNKDEYKVI